MKENSEHDVIGELFRQKLENHRLPVGNNGWDEIERRLNKRNNKNVIWLWYSGAMAAAIAGIAMILITSRPEIEKATVMAVFQETYNTEVSETVSHATNTIAAEQETITILQPDVIKPTNNIALFEQEKTESLTDIDSVNVVVENEILIAAVENDTETQIKEDTPEVAQAVREILISDIFPYENIPAAKKEKWLLAVNFSMNSSNLESFDNDYNLYTPQAQHYSNGTRSSLNDYAVDLSNNIQSLSDANKNGFTSIRHLPPLSFGIMVRNIEKKAGIETGLVYTYLSSSFEWSDLSASYNVHQNLHYVGIPFNILGYLWNSNPNWQIYISGGFMAEKGLQAIYNQEMQEKTHTRITTTTAIKKNSIEGIQLSANGALGANYRLHKSWGIYFEPRVGYSFKSKQPISARTEWPLYFGINIGLNYQL